MEVKDYLNRLAERKRAGRVTTEHQLAGLAIAQLLGDEAHKSLYIKLAKQHDHEKLMTIAKSVAERKYVKNKGAYFMRVVHEELAI